MLLFIHLTVLGLDLYVDFFNFNFKKSIYFYLEDSCFTVIALVSAPHIKRLRTLCVPGS